MEVTNRLARPARIRVSLWDDATGAIALDLPERRMWPAGLIVAAMFAIFAGVEWTTFTQMTRQSVDDVFDLMGVLFMGFWLLGWSVGVVILGALTALLLFYRESARLQLGRLVHVPRLGPLKIFVEYDLAKVRNVRLERSDGDNKAQIKFDYGQGSTGLGDSMPRPDAEKLVSAIQGAAAAAGSLAEAAPAPEQNVPKLKPVPRAPETLDPPPSIVSPSGLALIAANLLPLAGVLYFGWDLASVIILFWAESAVIAFYTVLKIAMVEKFAALVEVPFFIGHFGGFMAIHFLFIYSFFVRGFDATGQGPGVREALLGIFGPLWTALAALFISHGVSFVTNFVGRREYEGATAKALMTAPYSRIIAMQVALIFGGWVIILLKSPVPVLALLVLIKTAADFSAHRKEHVSAGK